MKQQAGVRSYAHDKPSASVAGFSHEVEGELARELDEPVVAGLCDNENILDVRLDACSTCQGKRVGVNK